MSLCAARSLFFGFSLIFSTVSDEFFREGADGLAIMLRDFGSGVFLVESEGLCVISK
jgi:hypothetical protein